MQSKTGALLARFFKKGRDAAVRLIISTMAGLRQPKFAVILLVALFCAGSVVAQPNLNGAAAVSDSIHALDPSELG
jgi:hypothetical protein